MRLQKRVLLLFRLRLSPAAAEEGGGGSGGRGGGRGGEGRGRGGPGQQVIVREHRRRQVALEVDNVHLTARWRGLTGGQVDTWKRTGGEEGTA